MRYAALMVGVSLVLALGLRLAPLDAPAQLPGIGILAIAAPTTVIEGERYAVYGGFQSPDAYASMHLRICPERGGCLLRRSAPLPAGESWDWLGAFTPSTLGIYTAELLVLHPGQDARPGNLADRTAAHTSWQVSVVADLDRTEEVGGSARRHEPIRASDPARRAGDEGVVGRPAVAANDGALQGDGPGCSAGDLTSEPQVFAFNSFGRSWVCGRGAVTLTLEPLEASDAQSHSLAANAPLFVLWLGQEPLYEGRVLRPEVITLRVPRPGWLTWAYVNYPADTAAVKGVRISRVEFAPSR